MSYNPAITLAATKCMACCDEPHCRSIVVAGTGHGGPEAQQELLELEAAAVPAQSATGADHAVAGDDDRDGVRPEGVAGGAGGAVVARQLRHLAVGAHLAVRNLVRPLQHLAGKPLHQSPIERQREALPAPGEVF